MPDTQLFSIKTEVFEGPLELLLDLIEQRKLLINNISLAAVTDEYMAYIGTIAENQLPETTQFVLIASTLLLIKSRSLLPVLDLTDEEEVSITDLETRLKLYQIYRRASMMLKEIFGTRMLYKRPFQAITVPLFIPDSYTTLQSIKAAISSVLVNLPKKETPHVQVAVQKVISLEDMMRRLEERITKQFKISFSTFADSREQAHVIVSFLAVLELIKQGIIMVRQEVRFADFDIEREIVDTPHYL